MCVIAALLRKEDAAAAAQAARRHWRPRTHVFGGKDWSNITDYYVSREGKTVNESPEYAVLCGDLAEVATAALPERIREAVSLTEVFINFYSTSHNSKAFAIPNHSDTTTVSVVIALENTTVLTVRA